MTELQNIPPQAVEIEKAVLSALMIDKKAFLDLNGMLTNTDFYSNAHQLIFSAIHKLDSQFCDIDLLTITEQLNKDKNIEKVGGVAYIAQLSSYVHSFEHITNHARIIKEKSIARSLISIGIELQKKGYDPNNDIKDTLDFAERQIFNIGLGNLTKDYEHISDASERAIKEVEKIANSGETPGIYTQSNELNEILGGFKKSDLIILAARPSMGKTAVALSFARHAALNGKCVMFFSLEMSNTQLAKRLISTQTQIASHKLTFGNMDDTDWNDVTNRMPQLSESDFYLDDTPALTISELRTKLRRLTMKKAVDLVVIDYLQLMSAPEFKHHREREIAYLSGSLKQIAKEFDIPVIALSQLNRAVESRPDKKPNLSDLRESGAIEQDADIVGFIWRPEKYFETMENPETKVHESTANQTYVIVEKNRNGQLADVLMYSDLSTFTYTDWNTKQITDEINQENSNFKAFEPDNNNDLQQNNSFDETPF